MGGSEKERQEEGKEYGSKVERGGKNRKALMCRAY